MPKIIIMPYNQIENVCQDAMTFANSCQSDFTFYLIPQTKMANSPLNKERVEFTEILEHLESVRNLYSYANDDLILAFYNGILEASNHGLTNLFLAVSRYDEKPPCTGVISIKYLDWNILEEKYNYEIQKHSILHLIICGIIGSYTDLKAHENIGCLLDFNASLTSFNLKLQKGYYLCSNKEYCCYDKIQREKYGEAILRLCKSFKNSNYRTVIKEFIVGDKMTIDKSTHINAPITNSNVNVHSSDSIQKLTINSNLERLFSEIINKIENDGSISKKEYKEIAIKIDELKFELNQSKPKKDIIEKILSNLGSIASIAAFVDKIYPFLPMLY